MRGQGFEHLKGVAYALIAFAIYATHDVFIKMLGAKYSPFQIIFFATLLSFPLVTLMLMRNSKPGHLRPVHPWWIALRTFSTVITGFSAFYAFSVLPLAQTYAILFASPLLVTLLAIPVLGERVRIRRWIAVAVGLAGVIVVLRPGTTALGLGHFAALMAALFGSLASIIVRKIGKDERDEVLLLYPMVANFALMSVLLAFVYKPMPIQDLGLVGLVSSFGLVAGLLLIAAYRNAEAAMVAPMQYSQMIWASIYGYMIFGERLDLATVVGAAIIIASGLYIVLRERTLGTSQNTPVLRTRSRHETGSTFRVSPFLRRDRNSK